MKRQLPTVAFLWKRWFWTVRVMAPIVCCLFLVTYFLPFSWLYSTLHGQEALMQAAKELNHRRIEAARSYFKQSANKTFEELQAMYRRAQKASLKFTIVIITVGRRKLQNSDHSVGYVLQSAAAVDAVVKRSPFLNDSFVFICNVDRYPQHHTDAVELKAYLPYVERYGHSVIPEISELAIFGSKELYRKTSHKHTFDQERYDYMFCLQVAHHFQSEYYLILQDDAILRPDFPEVLELSLNKLNKARKCSQDTSSSASYLACLSENPPYASNFLPERDRLIFPSPNASFAYLKFFFPERWQGFAFEPLRLLDLLSLAAVGGALGLIAQAVCAYRRKLTFEPSCRTFCLGTVLAVLTVCFVGRQNINELRRLSRYLYRLQPSPSCCIPAMLYPAAVMPFLLTWLLDSAEGSYVDMRVSELSQYYQVPAYYIEPNLVQHVGMITSLAKENRKPLEEFVL